MIYKYQTASRKGLISVKESIWLIIFLFGVLGCAPEIRHTGVSPTASSPTVVNTKMPSAIQPSPTVFATKTPTIQGIGRECIEVGLPPAEGTDGVLVFQKAFGDPLILLNGRTQNQQSVPAAPDMQVLGAHVSPDAKWLIYEVDPGDLSGEYKVVLVNAGGVKQKEMPYGDWGSTSMFWLNNQALRVAEPDNSMTYIKNYAMDPFGETKIALPSDFPAAMGEGVDWGIDSNALDLGISKGINIIYDPALTLAVYPKSVSSIALFNLETKQEIAQLAIPGEAQLPRWSPDGTKLAVIGTESDSVNHSQFDEFLIIDRDGRITSRFPYQEDSMQTTHIENYSWSPDSSRIAFWITTDNASPKNSKNLFELAVLDLQTNELTNYCISGTSTIEYETYTDTVNIIWSPDGTELLIIRYNDDNESIDDVVVDLTNRTAYRVAENMQPFGWMTEQP